MFSIVPFCPFADTFIELIIIVLQDKFNSEPHLLRESSSQFIKKSFFFRANRQKAKMKLFSCTQYDFSVSRCDWRILEGNEKRIVRDCLKHVVYMLNSQSVSTVTSRTETSVSHARSDSTTPPTTTGPARSGASAPPVQRGKPPRHPGPRSSPNAVRTEFYP